MFLWLHNPTLDINKFFWLRWWHWWTYLFICKVQSEKEVPYTTVDKTSTNWLSLPSGDQLSIHKYSPIKEGGTLWYLTHISHLRWQIKCKFYGCGQTSTNAGCREWISTSRKMFWIIILKMKWVIHIELLLFKFSNVIIKKSKMGCDYLVWKAI